MSSCKVCMSASLVVAVRMVSHVSDFVLRDLRDDIEEAKMVSLMLS